MEHFKKRFPAGSGQARLIRTMSLGGDPFTCTGWTGAMDLYETTDGFVLYMDVSGVSPEHLQVVAEEGRVTVSGERGYPLPDQVRYVHQLEIEQGVFEKSITLPKPIDVSRTTSRVKNGFLEVVMPFARGSGRVKITVR